MSIADALSQKFASYTDAEEAAERVSLEYTGQYYVNVLRGEQLYVVDTLSSFEYQDYYEAGKYVNPGDSVNDGAQ